VGTQITWDANLARSVFIYDGTICPRAVYAASHVLVVDGEQWDVDMRVLRSGLEGKRRKFKAPFATEPIAPDVGAEFGRLGEHADKLFSRLYPTFAGSERRAAWRPMITGPEPMHFDTHPRQTGNVPFVTAFVNVSSVPRVYHIGPNLEQLVASQPKVMRQILRDDCGGDVAKLSYFIRLHTVANDPPLGTDAPRHRVEFAPGAIWFFNPKTVSHEVIYGEGAASFSWLVPDAGVRMQADIVRGLL
jgi:hypothetical protein